MRRGMNKKGQMIFSEYVMIFFVVIAAATAMTTFVQRCFKAQVHDARNLMISTANSAADANFLMATGGSSIPYEYEPYYDVHSSSIGKIEDDSVGKTSGSPTVIGVKYIKKENHQTGTFTNGSQLPPECAVANPPAYCGQGGLCLCLAGAICGNDSCGNQYGCGACPSKNQTCSGDQTQCQGSPSCTDNSSCSFNYRCVSLQCVICPIVNGSYDCTAGL